jgi:restriction endonuclease S subunit
MNQTVLAEQADKQQGKIAPEPCYMSNATTIEVIYSETIASVVIPVPPLSEQKTILVFLQN